MSQNVLIVAQVYCTPKKHEQGIIKFQMNGMETATTNNNKQQTHSKTNTNTHTHIHTHIYNHIVSYL